MQPSLQFLGFIYKIYKSFIGRLETLVEAEGGQWTFWETLVNYVYYLVLYPKK